MASHDLPHPPSDAIAHHRAAQRLLDAEAEAAFRQLVGAKENSEVGTGPAFARAIDGIELAAPKNARRTGKIQAPRLTRV